MGANTTVVFADLTGSTRLFEALGNARAVEQVTRLTQWIGGLCEAHGGRVVKMLGDGVLAVFPDARGAVQAVIALQRANAERLPRERARMRLQIGVAAGEVIEVGGDCYGDAVNVASRLSDLSGPDRIWATRTVVSQLGAPGDEVRFRSLGAIPLRGRSEAAEVFQVDWEDDTQGHSLTRPAALSGVWRPKPPAAGGVRLAWLDQQKGFRVTDLPVHLGRSEAAEFAVQDDRVSRLHARIEWRNGSFVLTDTSSYGTWVRFDSAPGELALRRDECILVGSGQVALGGSFEDFTVPKVHFQLVAANH